jgi:hypothetical protein
MKENENNIKEHLSVMVFPFRIINEKMDNDAFDFKDSKIENVSEVSIKGFTDKLNKIETVSDNIVDPKHHNFIKNYIADANAKNDSAFLQVFSINQTHFAKKNENINYNLNKHKLFVEGIGDVEFANMCYVVLNEFAQLGYFIFGLKIESNEDASLEKLSNSKFFRYYTDDTNNEKNNFQYSINVYDKNDESRDVISRFSIQKIIESYFGGLLSHLKFLYRKPINFHLFGKNYLSEFDGSTYEQFLFNLLRMPANGDYIATEANSVNKDFIQSTIDGIIFCALNEGASVFDNSINNPLSLFKKYFPSFILALNQREIMIRTNSEISILNISDFESGINDSVIERLKKLKKNINIFQLKQVIYSISFYNEISLFYSELQKNFSIELLLKDNKQSVMEIHSLLENESQETSMKLEKNRSDRFNWIIGFLTIIQCASAIAAIFGYNRISSILLFVSFIPILMYVLNKITKKYKD